MSSTAAAAAVFLCRFAAGGVGREEVAAVDVEGDEDEGDGANEALMRLRVWAFAAASDGGRCLHACAARCLHGSTRVGRQPEDTTAGCWLKETHARQKKPAQAGQATARPTSVAPSLRSNTTIRGLEQPASSHGPAADSGTAVEEDDALEAATGSAQPWATNELWSRQKTWRAEAEPRDIVSSSSTLEGEEGERPDAPRGRSGSGGAAGRASGSERSARRSGRGPCRWCGGRGRGGRRPGAAGGSRGWCVSSSLPRTSTSPRDASCGCNASSWPKMTRRAHRATDSRSRVSTGTLC